MSLIEIKVPDIGDFKEVEVIELLVKPGDTVKAEQSLITVESDKASMEIPSSHAGVVKELKIKIGDKVAEGSLMLILEASENAAAPVAVAAAPAAVSAAAPAPAAATATASASVAAAPAAIAAPVPAASSSLNQPGQKSHASPSIRKFARELGVDLSRVKGSGPKGRVILEDVHGFVKGVMQNDSAVAGTAVATGAGLSGAGLSLLPWPSLDFSKFGATELLPLSRIKKISGPNLHRNWVMIPHVTNHDDADVTDLEAFRVQLNQEADKGAAKVTMLAFLIKACVSALRRFPEFIAIHYC